MYEAQTNSLLVNDFDLNQDCVQLTVSDQNLCGN